MAINSSSITIKNAIATEGVVVPVFFSEDNFPNSEVGAYIFNAGNGFFYLRIQDPDTLENKWKQVPPIADPIV